MDNRSSILARPRLARGAIFSLFDPREADLPAQRAPPEAQARLPCAHVDARRPRDPEAAPRARAASASPPELRRVQRRHRLSRSRDFDAVYRQGRSVSTRFLVLYWFAARGRRASRGSVCRAEGGRRRRRPQPDQAAAARGLARAASSACRPGSDYVLIVAPGPARGGRGARLRVARRARRRGARQRRRRRDGTSAIAALVCVLPLHARRASSPAGHVQVPPALLAVRARRAATSTGSLRGSLLAGWRLLRCNPWSRGGVDYGTTRVSSRLILDSLLTPLEDLLRRVLDWLHDSVGLPWAWAIVALTIIVRMLLVPLTVRQIHSMQNLQAHAPQMKEIQKKYKGDGRSSNEELMKFYKENNINPAASCLPMLGADPGLHRALLRAAGLRERSLPEVPGQRPRATSPGSHFVPASPTRRPRTGRATCCSSSTRPASSRRRTSCRRRWTRRSATMLMVLPLVFVPFVITLPGRARPLLGDDEPVDGRPGARHAAAACRRRGRAAEKRLVAHAAEDGSATATAPRPTPAAAPAARQPTAQPRRVQAEEEARAAVSDGAASGRGDGRDRRRGEVGGAARARAAASGPRQGGGAVPGVTEGERGLLGVGYAPARVDRTSVGESRGRRSRATRASSRREVRELVERIVGGHRRSRAGSTSARTTRRSRRPARRRARAADRQARPDDRRGPVPRERDRRAARRRRGARTSSSTRRATASGGARRSRRWRCAQRERALDGRRARRARADDGGRAEGRAPAPEGVRRRRDGERGHRAEPLRRRPRRVRLAARALARGARRDARADGDRRRRGGAARCCSSDSLRARRRRARLRRADRRRGLRRRRAGDPARGRASRARGDAARGGAAQVRLPRAVRAVRTCASCGAAPRSSETDCRRRASRRRSRRRRSRRSGACRSCARAARSCSGSGRAPTPSGSRAWPSGSAAARSPRRRGLLVLRKSRPTPGAFRAGRAWRGSVRSRS